jgi:peptide/nickel transport system permease protein
MIRFVLFRLLQTIIALLGISILIFLLVRATGNPIDLMRQNIASEEDVARMKADWGLDKPYPEQYWLFIKGAVQGDFGKSILRGRPVMEMIIQAAPNSIKLGLLTFVVSMTMGTLLGVIAAIKRDTWIDNIVKFLAVLGQGLPGFWVAIVSIWFFATPDFFGRPLLPSFGTAHAANYVLPVGCLSFFLLPGMMRLVRSSMLDVLDSEYVKLARIKGLPERMVIWKHAFRNALIAPLTVAGMLLAMLVSGAVVIETVFAWPGLGKLGVDAMIARDFPVSQALIVLVATLILLINLIVDITYAYIDPQIRYQST